MDRVWTITCKQMESRSKGMELMWEWTFIESQNTDAFIPQVFMLFLLPGRTPCSRNTALAFREPEVSVSKAMPFKGGNGNPERVRNITQITKLIGSRARIRMTITLHVYTLGLWKDVNLRFSRPRSQSWLSHPLALRSLPPPPPPDHMLYGPLEEWIRRCVLPLWASALWAREYFTEMFPPTGLWLVLAQCLENTHYMMKQDCHSADYQ